MNNRELVVSIKHSVSVAVNSTHSMSWSSAIEQAKTFDQVLAGKLTALVGAYRDIKEYLENRGL